ncbi:MAG: dihydropteroate synthase [Candidatus Omnitrophota bacterium]|jgi:dihydropteroate synthase
MTPRLKTSQSQSYNNKIYRFGDVSHDVTETPLIMGILNVTPDSFSDGGVYLDPHRAADHAIQMTANGADIIDIGAQTSKPGSLEISVEEELKRLEPVLKLLKQKKVAPISIDTSKFNVMQMGAHYGVDIINDIHATWQDDRIPIFISQNKLSLISMHMRGTPSTMQADTSYEDLNSEIKSFFTRTLARLLDCGVSAERLAFDPGIGFGKSPTDCLQILRDISDLTIEQHAIVIGLSKKSFINKCFGLDDGASKEANNLLHLCALQNGASILRVHDIIDAVLVRDIYKKTRKL